MTASDLKRFPMLAEFSAEDREALFELLDPQVFRKRKQQC